MSLSAHLDLESLVADTIYERLVFLQTRCEGFPRNILGVMGAMLSVDWLQGLRMCGALSESLASLHVGTSGLRLRP